MFHFTGCRFTALLLTCRLWGRNRRTLLRRGYPIRKPTGQSVLAAGRGLSQLTASFFASWHQGIPDAPLVACLDGSMDPALDRLESLLEKETLFNPPRALSPKWSLALSVCVVSVYALYPISMCRCQRTLARRCGGGRNWSRVCAARRTHARRPNLRWWILPASYRRAKTESCVTVSTFLGLAALSFRAGLGGLARPHSQPRAGCGPSALAVDLFDSRGSGLFYERQAPGGSTP
jgi:hypothetical protein